MKGGFKVDIKEVIRASYKACHSACISFLACSNIIYYIEEEEEGGGVSKHSLNPEGSADSFTWKHLNIKNTAVKGLLSPRITLRPNLATNG